MAEATSVEINSINTEESAIKSTDEEILPTQDTHVPARDIKTKIVENDCGGSLNDLPPTPPLQANEEEEKVDIKKDKTGNEEKQHSTETDDEFVELRPKYRVRKSQITTEDIESLIVKCTACRKQINHHDSHRVKRHPHLKVLICKDCLDFYGSGEFSQDEEGDKYCRWCAQGGTLFGCDICNNAFCNDCVRLNFGRGEARSISIENNWKCYICDPKRLEEKINFCNLLYEYSKGKSPLFKKKSNKKSPIAFNINRSDFEITDPQSWLSAVIENSINIMGKYKFQLDRLKKKVQERTRSTKYSLRKMDEITRELRSSSKNNFKHAENLYQSYVKHKGSFNKSSDLSGNNSDSTPEKSKNCVTSSGAVNGTNHVSNEKTIKLTQSQEVLEGENLKTSSPINSDLEMIVSDSEDVHRSSKSPLKAPRGSSSESKPIEISPTKSKSSEAEDQEVICLDSSDLSSETMSIKNSKSHSKFEDKNKHELKIIEKEILESPAHRPKANSCEPDLKSENRPSKSEKSSSESTSDSSSSFDSSMDEKKRRKKKAVKIKMKFPKKKKKTVRSDLSSSEFSTDLKKSNKQKIRAKMEEQSIFTREEVVRWNLNKEAMLKDDVKLKLYPAVELPNDLDKTEEQCKVVLDYYAKKESKDDLKSMQKSVNRLLSGSSRKRGATSSDADSKVSSKNTGSKNAKKRKLLSSSSDSPTSSTSDSDVSTVKKKKELVKSNKKSKKIVSDDSDSSGKDIDSIAENSKTKKKSTKKAKSSSNSNSEVISIDDSDDNDFIITKRSRKDDKLSRKANELLRDKKGKKSKSSNDKSKGKKKQKKRKVVFSDSDSESSTSSSNTSSSEVSDSDFEKKKKGKKKKQARKRVKIDNSSDEDKSDDDGNENPDSQSTPGKGRKNIRKVISDGNLRKDTREAQLIEKERRRRVQDRQKLYNCIVENVGKGQDVITKKMVLEVDAESKEEVVEIHPDVVEKLKPHQIDGVKFMWESTIESLKELEKSPGSGCILAHCMGLGKTLQVIAFLYTVLTNKHTSKKLHTALIICPNNTVLNWSNEFDIWLEDCTDSINVFEMVKIKDYSSRLELLRNWQKDGGVLIVGYECFARLVDGKIPKKTKQFKAHVFEAIANPGPDIVVCDEGHKLKNEKSMLARCANQIKTSRRIILTGTPLQNNLKEYYCMMNFVKPSLLGTCKEFVNRFVNPITNGQYDDSDKKDVKLMKKRVHILHKLLEGCVQRCDYSALTKFLPPKHEFVISVRMSEVQIKLYQTYLDRNNRNSIEDGEVKVDGRQLFTDFMNLRSIWTFPYALQLSHEKRERAKLLKEDDADEDGNLKDFINDDTSSDSSDENEEVKCLDKDDLDVAGPSKRTRGQKKNDSSDDEIIKSYPRPKASDSDNEDAPMEKQWFNEYFTEEDKLKAELGGKLLLMLEILKACESIGDKMLIFSQSLITLDIIEMFLKDIHQKQAKVDSVLPDANDIFQTWIEGVDYFRMDGKTNVENRQGFMRKFNHKENSRARLFLISTKAGSLGTNLVGANRVILFDASWNPSDDVQSIFRVYRFGQEKPVYIYRFLAQGTMEEKIYNRQVTKLSMSCRVVDEQNIDRHFNLSQLAELYAFEPDVSVERPTLMVPKDRLLADIIMSHRDWIVNFFEHDSLLQHTEDEDLTEEDRQAAWAEYENEKEGLFQQWEPNANINNNASSNTFNSGGYRTVVFEISAAIRKIGEEVKRRSPNCNMYEFQSSLFAQVTMLKNKCQSNHVSLLRQKQDYVSKGLQVPVYINQDMERIHVMVSQIDHSLMKIREDLKNELQKIQQRATQQSNMTKAQADILRNMGVRFQQQFAANAQNPLRFTFVNFQNVRPQQPTATSTKPPGPKIVEITEDEGSNDQQGPSSNSTKPVITFVEESEPTEPPPKEVKSKQSVKITEVD